MKIIVDAMGGDNAPMAPVEGAIRAAETLETEITLVGRAEVILSCIEKLGLKTLPKGVEIAHAEQVIEMEDNPATAFKQKKDSSMTVGLELLKQGRGDAFISAGSTGALLSGATLLVKRVRGIRRAALAPVVPNANGSTVLIDCGATADCKPEYLLQYAFMGSFYAKRFLHIPEPRVGLLNIGAEPSKGLDLQRAAYALLTKADQEGRIHFAGNIEGREAITEGVDVLVTDGFSGNIFLKTFEGTAKLFESMVKTMFTRKTKYKMAAMLMAEDLTAMRKIFDPSEIGGTALLGISKPVIKAHGSSNAYAITNAVRQAVLVAESGLIDDITANVEYMRLPAQSAGTVEG